ncbi:MAG: hypothetical protein M1816_003178 [Peltula sp. TS41687]|nr:MAG: hypothetical protein M1816_003178 [Peltula sp. TS41687]
MSRESSQTSTSPTPSPSTPLPTVRTLDKPEKLRDLLAEDRGDTCMPCRMIGASAFIGVGVYSYFSGRYQLRQQEEAIRKSRSLFGMRSRRLGISGIAGVLVGMGIWRLVA